MTVVTGRLPAGASRGAADFADLATVTSVGFGPDGLLQVTTNPDVDAATAQRINDRIECVNANEETLRQQARTALTNNRAFIANTAPQLLSGADQIINAAGSSAQEVNLAKAVKSLTNQATAAAQQNDKLIRFALGDFDGTD